MSKYFGKYNSDSALINAVINGELTKPYVALVGGEVNYDEYRSEPYFNYNGNSAATIEGHITSLNLDIYGGEWTVTTAADWITINPSAGTGEDVVSLAMSMNEGSSARSATIIAHFGEDTISFNLTQNAVDFAYLPLTLSVLSAGTLGIKNESPSYQWGNSFEYNLNGAGWLPATGNGKQLELSVVPGDTIQLRSDAETDWCGWHQFIGGTAAYNVYGNLLSLQSATGFTAETSARGYANMYRELFSGSSVVSAENLVFPDRGCIDGAASIFQGMFADCTALTTAPKVLPSQNFTDSMFYEMFTNCTSLTTPPQLPCNSQYMAYALYGRMFAGCTSLTTAPALPYNDGLGNFTYGQMFYGCSSLNRIECMATWAGYSNATEAWTSGVASTGTFVKAPTADFWTEGVDGIPVGWTVVDAS